MGVSIIDIQRESIISSIKDASRGQWKVLVVDDDSWKLVQNVVKEDDILSHRVTNIEHIEQKRQPQKDTDVIYLLTPEPHIVECLLADLERKRYGRAVILWTSLLHASLRERIDKSRLAQEQIQAFQVLDIGYHPRESQVVTFRDPWSFPILFHPACNNLIKNHIEDLARKVVSVCVSLGEYPTIRYYEPPYASHAAKVLCSHLASFVQREIDMYATYHKDFPPQSTRPRGTLYILDRSIDLLSPVLHEFTYQAMIHDLLKLNDGQKVTYRVNVNEGRADQQEKELEIAEKDKVWVANRHRHMKDTIDKLMGEFQKFMDENPHFTKADASNANSLSAIKDMMAGLPQFQEMKETYSLHLTMAQESMNIFQNRKLADLASVEQSLATGLDEDYKKPKNLADQVVRLLDDESVIESDRLRLIVLYILFRDGILPADTIKLLAHAQLNPRDNEVIKNMGHLGARVTRALKDPRTAPPPLFPPKPVPMNVQDEYSLSRYDPVLKTLLIEHSKNTVDNNVFPYTKPQLDASEGMYETTSHTSLRSAKPTWARTRTTGNEAKQRVIVFMAGGATYSEARSCYEASRETNRDVYLVTSHMISPSLFLRQVSDLSADRSRLGIPSDRPKKQAPAHVFEVEQPPQPKPQQQQAPQKSQSNGPPTSQMGNMRLDASKPANGAANRAPSSHAQPEKQQPPPNQSSGGEKKKHRFGFGLK